MLPPDAFHDLVDLGVGFDVIQARPGVPNTTLRVARTPSGDLAVTKPPETGAAPVLYTGPARGALAVLNALVMGADGRPAAASSLVEGHASSLVVRPTGAAATRRRLKAFHARSEVLYADPADRTPRKAVVSLAALGKTTLHLVEARDGDGISPVERLSPNALPPALHAELAARGHFVEPFLAANGKAALAVAKARRARETEKALPPADAQPPAMPNPAKQTGRPVPGADGLYPYAFVQKVPTDRGAVFVRSEGRVRIPSVPEGVPAFSGEFLVPKGTSSIRPLLTPLDIHAVGDALYSRLEPVAGTNLPQHFGRLDDLADVLAWRSQPRNGTSGHPFVMAFRVSRPDGAEDLCERTCPPDWPIVRYGKVVDRHHVHAAAYDGLLAEAPRQGMHHYAAFAAGKRAAGPPRIVPERDLDPGLAALAKDEGDRIRRAVTEGVEGNLALVGTRLMVRTPEPCWRLALAKGGDLRLDLYLADGLRTGPGIEPTLFFALDETEERDKAIGSLLERVAVPEVRERGRLERLDPSACRMDGRATTFAHLCAGLSESLHHASRILPASAAAATAGLRAVLPTEYQRGYLPVLARGGDADDRIDAVFEAWERFARDAAGSLGAASPPPWLIRLAGHGEVLRCLAVDLSPAPGPDTPRP